MNETIFIDLHCHPASKPIGKSFKKGSTPFKHSENDTDKNCLWYQDRPEDFEKSLNKFTSLTKFTQSDMKSMVKGNTMVFSASLYPFEKGFVKTRFGPFLPTDALVNLITGYSKPRLDHISRMPSYFTVLIAVDAPD